MSRPKLFVNKYVSKLRIGRINSILKDKFLKFEQVMMNNSGRTLQIDDAGIEDVESIVTALDRSLFATKSIADAMRRELDFLTSTAKSRVYPTVQDYLDYYNSHTTLHVDQHAYIKPRFTSLYDRVLGVMDEIGLRDALWLLKLIGRDRGCDIDIESFIMIPETYSELLLKNHRNMSYDNHIPPRLDEPDRFNKMLCIASMARFLIPDIGLTGQDSREK